MLINLPFKNIDKAKIKNFEISNDFKKLEFEYHNQKFKFIIEKAEKNKFILNSLEKKFEETE